MEIFWETKPYQNHIDVLVRSRENPSPKTDNEVFLGEIMFNDNLDMTDLLFHASDPQTLGAGVAEALAIFKSHDWEVQVSNELTPFIRDHSLCGKEFKDSFMATWEPSLFSRVFGRRSK